MREEKTADEKCDDQREQGRFHRKVVNSTKPEAGLDSSSCRSITLRLVVEENVQEQNNPSAGRVKKKYNRQPGITPNPKIRVHSRQQRSADNQGRDKLVLR